MTINLEQLVTLILCLGLGYLSYKVYSAFTRLTRAIEHIASCVIPVEEVQKRTEALQAASFSQDKFLKDMEEVNNRLRKDAGLM